MFRQKYTDKIDPVFAKLKAGFDSVSVVTAAKFLRNYPEFNEVYVNLDLTEAERDLDRELRESKKDFNRLQKKGGVDHGRFEKVELPDSVRIEPLDNTSRKQPETTATPKYQKT